MPMKSKNPIHKNLHRILLKIALALFFIIWLIPCTAILIFAYLISFISKRFANSIGGFLGFSLWSICNLIFKLSSKLTIPNIPKNNYIVVSNHISAMDFMLVNTVNTYNLSDSKYCFKKSLLFIIPIFFPWSQACNQIVLTRAYEEDKKIIEKFAKTMSKYKFPAWIVLFCEGTRFTETKKKMSDEFCEGLGIEPFRNVLCPRYKGFTMLYRSLKDSHIGKVLDLTFYCKDKSLSLINVLFTGEIYEILCDFRIVDFKAIDKPEEFIIDAYRRKDDLIDQWNLKEMNKKVN